MKADDNRYLSYILITAARNEEAYIENTLRSVISQRVLPKKWIIVSDGSTDRTDEIVKRCTMNNIWIELIRMPEHEVRQFAAKAHCFNIGFQLVQEIDYDIIGNLDADITFEEDYFEFLLEKFAEYPNLGVAATPMIEKYYDPVKEGFYNETDVFGPCQLFRRECLEMIGGFVPIKRGVEWVAVKTARMHGWKTRSFLGKTFFHHRPTGTAESNFWMARFNQGKEDYFLENHPLWELLKIAYNMTRKPFIIGGLLLLSGYLWALMSQMERPISKELVKFHRSEQMQRLKSIIKFRQ